MYLSHVYLLFQLEIVFITINIHIICLVLSLDIVLKKKKTSAYGMVVFNIDSLGLKAISRLQCRINSQGFVFTFCSLNLFSCHPFLLILDNIQFGGLLFSRISKNFLLFPRRYTYLSNGETELVCQAVCFFFFIEIIKSLPTMGGGDLLFLQSPPAGSAAATCFSSHSKTHARLFSKHLQYAY